MFQFHKEESDCLKKELCNVCKKDIQGILSDKQMAKFEDAFYKAFDGYLLKRRGEKSGSSINNSVLQ